MSKTTNTIRLSPAVPDRWKWADHLQKCSQSSLGYTFWKMVPEAIWRRQGFSVQRVLRTIYTSVRQRNSFTTTFTMRNVEKLTLRIRKIQCGFDIGSHLIEWLRRVLRTIYFQTSNPTIFKVLAPILQRVLRTPHRRRLAGALKFSKFLKNGAKHSSESLY